MLPKYKTILLTTDFSPNCEHAFKHAISLARQHDAKITMLHVIRELDSRISSFMTNMMGTSQYKSLLENHEKIALDETKAELNQFASEELTDSPEDLERVTDFEALHGNPATQILSLSHEIDADIIVMAAHAKGLFDQTIIGSVTQQVLHRSHRPVLVVPPPKSDNS